LALNLLCPPISLNLERFNHCLALRFRPFTLLVEALLALLVSGLSRN
jgi:hypothetical protein